MNHLHTAQWSGVLVYCLRSALTKSSDGAQNVIGRLDPLEGLWMRVGHHDVLTDGGLEPRTLGCATRRSWRSVSSENQRSTRLTDEAPIGVKWRCNRGRFSSHRRIRADYACHSYRESDVRPNEVGRGLDGVEKLTEFSGPMSLKKLPNDAARLDFQRGEERVRAMAAIVMRAALDLPGSHRQQRARAVQGCFSVGKTAPRPGSHRQQRARAVQGLNLRLLIDAQDERVIRGMEIQPNNITDLLDEQRISRQLEPLGPMRLQAKGSPDAVHGTTAHPACPCYGARAPVRRVRGHRFQGLGDDPFNGRIRHRARRAGAWFIQQSIKALGGKALAPFTDGVLSHTHLIGHGCVGLTLATGQNNAHPLRQRLSGLRAPSPLLQGLLFVHRQRKRGCRSSGSQDVLPSIPEDTRTAQLIPRTSETGH